MVALAQRMLPQFPKLMCTSYFTLLVHMQSLYIKAVKIMEL